MEIRGKIMDWEQLNIVVIGEACSWGQFDKAKVCRKKLLKLSLYLTNGIQSMVDCSHEFTTRYI